MELKTKLKCPHCGHEWETTSKLKMVTCPSCQLKVKNQVLRKEQVKPHDEQVHEKTQKD